MELPRFFLASSIPRGVKKAILDTAKKCDDHHALLQQLRDANIIYRIFEFEGAPQGYCNLPPLQSGDEWISNSPQKRLENSGYVLTKVQGETLHHRGNEWLVAWNDTQQWLTRRKGGIHYVYILVPISRTAD